MRLIKRKTMILLTLIVSITFFGISKQPIVAHAHEHAVHEQHEHQPQMLLQNNTLNLENPNALEIVSTIEEELREQGTSILAELYKQYDFYFNELSSVTNDRQENILLKLNKMDEVIAHYERQSSLLSMDSDFSENDPMSINSTSTYIFGISPDCNCQWYDYLLGVPCFNCVLYSDTLMAVSAIATGFSLRGWSLAADLMWHNMSNNSLDSDYTPSSSLVNRVAQSPQILDEVAQKDALTGGHTQANPGRLNGLFANTLDGDVFNALGKFNYSKSYAGNGKINISIQDRYDWERDGDSPGGILLDIMVTAQEIGIVTPFYTIMDITVTGTASLSWEYTSTGISITGAPNNISQIDIPSELLDLRVRDINLPKVAVTTIGNDAFSGCTQLSKISIPKSIKTIGQSAFAGCTNLSTIKIPASVTSISSNAFKDCSSLIIYPDVSSKPRGWDSDWNSSKRPVVWGGHEPQLFNDSVILSNYNYPSQYNNFNPISQDITTQSGYSIITNRLRCGVIDYAGKSYLTLSAKNKDATIAYLEYYFTDYIIKIDYQLALWSSDESLVLNSSIRLEVLYNNQWTSIRTFGATSMSQNKDLLLNYSTILNDPTKAFRFIVETNQVNNDNNRGRVVIGDINVLETEDNHVHEYTYSYIPIPHSGKFPVNEHTSYCSCGAHVDERCLGKIAEDGIAYCIYCGRDMTGGLGQILFSITLPNNLILVSDETITLNDIILATKHLELNYGLLDFQNIVNKQIIMDEYTLYDDSNKYKQIILNSFT